MLRNVYEPFRDIYGILAKSAQGDEFNLKENKEEIQLEKNNDKLLMFW